MNNELNIALSSLLIKEEPQAGNIYAGMPVSLYHHGHGICSSIIKKVLHSIEYFLNKDNPESENEEIPVLITDIVMKLKEEGRGFIFATLAKTRLFSVGVYRLDNESMRVGSDLYRDILYVYSFNEDKFLVILLVAFCSNTGFALHAMKD